MLLHSPNYLWTGCRWKAKPWHWTPVGITQDCISSAHGRFMLYSVSLDAMQCWLEPLSPFYLSSSLSWFYSSVVALNVTEGNHGNKLPNFSHSKPIYEAHRSFSWYHTKIIPGGKGCSWMFIYVDNAQILEFADPLQFFLFTIQIHDLTLCYFINPSPVSFPSSLKVELVRQRVSRERGGFSYYGNFNVGCCLHYTSSRSYFFHTQEWKHTAACLSPGLVK